MARATAKDSSVMFHLAELQQIAERRVEETREAERGKLRAIEAERAADEHRRREERLRLIAERHEAREQRALAEAQLKSAERQLEIETQARLEQQRMELLIKKADAEMAAAEAARPQRRQGVWIALSLLLAAQVALFVLHQRAGERADAAQMRLLGQIEAFETKTQQLADSIGAKSQDIDSLRGAVESLRDDTRQGAEASTATSPSTPSTSSTRRPPRPPLTSSTRRPPATPIVPNIGSSPLGNLTEKRK